MNFDSLVCCKKVDEAGTKYFVVEGCQAAAKFMLNVS